MCCHSTAAIRAIPDCGHPFFCATELFVVGGYDAPTFCAQVRSRGGKARPIRKPHAHADHILGLDDVPRSLYYRQRAPIPIYGNAETLETDRSAYSAMRSLPSRPNQRSDARPACDPTASLSSARLEFLPVRLAMGAAPPSAYRFWPSRVILRITAIIQSLLRSLHNLLSYF